MSDLGEPQSPVQIGAADDENLVHDVEFSHNLSYLDHARATPHSTYLAGSQDGVENLEDYQAGGYHPIHLGDRLGNTGRYHVIHKLGHGGFSTVWLCRDSQEGKYVAVKVHTADVSAVDLPDLRLINLDKSAPGAEYINILRDHFSLEGPNGTHQCLVFTLLGPRKSWPDFEEILSVNCSCFEIPASEWSMPWSENKVLSLLGEPEESEVLTESGQNPPLSAPKYLVVSADLVRISAEYLMHQICVIDFGESFQASSPLANIGILEEYLAPEVIIEGGASIGPACDLWALGCTLFEIRRQMPLFYMINDTDELLAAMVGFFGKLPERWWGKWEARADFFDEFGKRIGFGGGGYEVTTLDKALNHKIEALRRPGKRKENKVLDMPEEEHALLKDLLTKLFTYTPGERLSAADVVQHDWFKM